MGIRVQAIEGVQGHTLTLRFSDGSAGVADLAEHLHGPVFEPLKDPKRFAEAYLEGGTVSWPTGADFAPEFLYSLAHRLPVPDTFEQAKVNEFDMSLRQLRELAGKRQTEVATAMGIDQGELSRFERRDDRMLSTLRRYIEALGGDLEVAAVLGGKRIPIRGV